MEGFVHISSVMKGIMRGNANYKKRRIAIMAQEKNKGKVIRTLRLDWRTRDFVDFLLCQYDDRTKAERFLYERGYITEEEQLYEWTQGIGQDGNPECVRKFKVLKVGGYNRSFN